MAVLLEQYWWVLVIALLLGIAIAWKIFASGRKTRVETNITPDVLDEGAAPARRNQAFIDAPPAAVKADSPAPVAPVMVPAATAPAATPASPVSADPVVPEPEQKPAPAAAPVSEEPAPTTAAQTSASSSQSGDDLTKIKGLGPKIAQILHSLGVTHYAQIAGWNDADIDRIDAQLGKFQGRIRRDNWVEQAALLTTGDASGFADRFGQV